VMLMQFILFCSGVIFILINIFHKFPFHLIIFGVCKILK